MSSDPAVLPYGDRALLVELADADEVVAWVDAVTDAAVDGIVDLVPAARTVLVVADVGADVATLRSALRRVSPRSSTATATSHDDEIVVEVRYDGPDLDDVSRHTGLSPAEVVAAHTGTPWRVAFGGFAPGFAYLTGGDDRLSVPRRDSSRTSVPAGSVGLADTFSGIYPRSSPGGWQLIGSTSAAVWDLDRDPPALLRPGASVRFVDVSQESR